MDEVPLPLLYPAVGILLLLPPPGSNFCCRMLFIAAADDTAAVAAAIGPNIDGPITGMLAMALYALMVD